MDENDKERIRNQFDKHVSGWSRRYGGWLGLITPTLRLRLSWFLRLLERHVHLPKNANVVDVGCGAGDILHALHEKGYTSLVGRDISKEMISLAGKSLPEAKFFVADMYALDSAQEARGCDLLLLLGVLSYYPEPLAKLERLKKILPDGGCIVFSFQNADSLFQKFNIRRMGNSNHM